MLRQASTLHPAILGLVFVTVTYALGVIAEGLSRVLTERWLVRVTRAAAEKGSLSEPASEAVSEAAELGEPGTPVQARVPTSSEAVSLREDWRMAAEAHEPAAKAIHAQLKRLRIERTFLFCSSLSLIPLGRAGHWALFVIVLCLAVGSVKLVHERFERYVQAIVRSYKVHVLHLGEGH